jgi:hypothetical protein
MTKSLQKGLIPSGGFSYRHLPINPFHGRLQKAKEVRLMGLLSEWEKRRSMDALM